VAHLVFQTAYPGDLFLSIPLLKSIKDWDPQSAIVLACRPGLGEFFKKSGLVSEVIEVDKKNVAGRRAALAALRAQTWDYIFVPHESVRTALWMTRLRARLGKVGFAKWWNHGFFSKRVVKPMAFPDALRQLSLLTAVDGGLAERFGMEEIQAFGGEDVAGAQGQSSAGKSQSAGSGPSATLTDFRQPVIPVWSSMQVKAHRTVSADGVRRVFLAPGSVWNTKRWTMEGYEAVARQLQARGFLVELVGSSAERAICDAIAAKVPGVVNRAGQTSLSDLVELFTTGVALICNDSGAMHAASAAGLPTVAIFGPTVLAQGFRPWQNLAVVVGRDLPCRPCGKHGSKECPLGTHECMRSLAPAQVLEAFDHLTK
jgi:heptosyltransferase-2